MIIKSHLLCFLIFALINTSYSLIPVMADEELYPGRHIGEVDSDLEVNVNDESELKASLLSLRFEKIQVDSMVNSMVASGRLKEEEATELKNELGIAELKKEKNGRGPASIDSDQ